MHVQIGDASLLRRHSSYKPAFSPLADVAQLVYLDHRGNDRSDLAKLRCPTLVLGGEDDPICTIDDEADIAAAIPQPLVRFERLEG